MLFSVFDPDLKIEAVEGKVFDPATAAMQQVRELAEVQLSCGVLQENALVEYADRQEISVLKGVDSSFRHLALIDSAIIDGAFTLTEDDIYYTLLGRGLAYTLGIKAAFAYPVKIFMPERTGKINMANPMASFVVEHAYISGVYQVDQPVYDDRFMLVPIELMRSMLDYEREVSALEIKLVPAANMPSVKKKIQQLVGEGFTVRDRFEQQESFFKIVQVEKWVTFLMLCFVLVLTLFNVLGSLTILMLEKEEDVKKLQSMGANNSLINRIFLFEGWMISIFGALIGIVIGIGICFVQQYFGLIKLGEAPGMFVIDAYPVKVEWTDVLIVLVTVVSLGLATVSYLVHLLGRRRLSREIAVCMVFTLFLASCVGQRKEAADGQKKEIAVSIDPIGYFGRKIAGDDYVFFPIVPAGRSPETYDPSISEMLRAGKSEAFFHINRIGFEQVIIKSLQSNNPNKFLFDLSDGWSFLPDGLHSDHADGCDHADNTDHHSHDGHHDHDGGHDPHIWASFTGAKVMSENICKALSSMNEARQDFYQINYQRLMDELAQLESELHEQLDTLTCRGFVIFHPALTYFAEEFGLVQYSIEEAGKDPSPASLKRLIDEVRRAQVKVVFVQLEFDRNYAEQIAKDLDARIVMINPLDQQWDTQMRRLAKALVTNGEVD